MTVSTRLLQSGRLQETQLCPQAFEAPAKPPVPATRVGLPAGGPVPSRWFCAGIWRSLRRAGRRGRDGIHGGAGLRRRAWRMDAPFPALTGLLAGVSKSQRSQHLRPPVPLPGGTRCPDSGAGGGAAASQPGLPRDFQLPAHGVRSAAEKVALKPTAPCSLVLGCRKMPPATPNSSEV